MTKNIIDRCPHCFVGQRFALAWILPLLWVSQDQRQGVGRLVSSWKLCGGNAPPGSFRCWRRPAPCGCGPQVPVGSA